MNGAYHIYESNQIMITADMMMSEYFPENLPFDSKKVAIMLAVDDLIFAKALAETREFRC